MSDIEEEIIGIIAKSLEVGEININSSVENTEEWDSLGHLSILVSLDKRFNGEVAGIKKMANIDSVKSILNVLKNNNLI
jgi:acyl carrier protein